MEEKSNQGKIGFSPNENDDSSKQEDSGEYAGNDKSAKSLGDGRWSYQGKIYKEQRIGKS